MRSRQSIVSRIAREPLVHFLLIGGVLFGFYGATADPEATSPDNRIVMTAGDIERLETLWQKRWQRPPTEAEVAGLINEQVREEVLYREALALGLDRDDAAIRRLLRQKYEFVTQDLAVDRTCRTGPNSSPGMMRIATGTARRPGSPSLRSISTSTGAARQASATPADARQPARRRRGPDGRRRRPAARPDYRDRSQDDITALFGPDFAEAVSRLAPGVWSGPMRSGYGVHLVRLDARSAGVTPGHSTEVADRVRADWEYDQRQQGQRRDLSPAAREVRGRDRAPELPAAPAGRGGAAVMLRLCLCAWPHCCSGAVPASAHESRPAYLDLREVASRPYEVLWKRPALGDRTLGLSVRWPVLAAMTRCRAGRSPFPARPIDAA